MRFLSSRPFNIHYRGSAEFQQVPGTSKLQVKQVLQYPQAAPVGSKNATISGYIPESVFRRNFFDKSITD